MKRVCSAEYGDRMRTYPRSPGAFRFRLQLHAIHSGPLAKEIDVTESGPLCAVRADRLAISLTIHIHEYILAV
jgi:hypothetical protein